MNREFIERFWLIKNNMRVFLLIFLVNMLILTIIVRGIFHFSIACNMPIIIVSGIIAAVMTEELVIPWLRRRERKAQSRS